MINSIQYTNAEETRIAIFLSSGGVVSGSYPTNSHYDSKIAAWLAEGNSISPYSISLTQAKSEKKNAIQAEYETAEALPVTLGAHEFDADTDAQSEVMAVLFRVDHGDTLPQDWTWPDADGVERSADTANMIALFKAINTKHQADRRNKHMLIKQVQAATTVSEVEAIPDW